ncbi:hypothetical protein [Lentzea sp. HUAS12]|uniref:hypothetical protein n=1 Tax=Lentzea sp. HUAS12 TaxID=2951806 RepID=UPI00209FD019|nr:hypothetical protein [Lentzea sp. HUAS12]USX53975.1 hypothetical protein ND450_07695 [Lentzea sp. HUAS12]
MRVPLGWIVLPLGASDWRRSVIAEDVGVRERAGAPGASAGPGGRCPGSTRVAGEVDRPGGGDGADSGADLVLSLAE